MAFVAVVMIVIFIDYIFHFAHRTISRFIAAAALAMHRTHVSAGILGSALISSLHIFRGGRVG